MSHLQNHQSLFEMAQNRQQELLIEAAQARQLQTAHAGSRPHVAVMDWLRRLTEPQLPSQYKIPTNKQANGWQ
jgi:hypothetical protein